MQPLTKLESYVQKGIDELKDQVNLFKNAFSIANLLFVPGLAPGAVGILWIVFVIFLLSTILFLAWSFQASPATREPYYIAFFITSIACAAYLAMATGNGLVTLRNFNGTWVWNDPLFATPVRRPHPAA
jgi:hypothetical protein